ncbi:PD-(D/E)XK nuclease family protein [Aeromicrobium phragmitis]|uniref:PD-(D/E)XK nuclease family protein n=1 Tax=Aeromicrobium phragmitis TaxID=2478914 RepID=A0A3L8PJW0_9ACTN|nr:PD-(D/E)XK nuclease family protein [Aeromicrobium phragmitis]RLV55645.1 PD-(D/E)XK nuclease family protein [Aeromicrobium phragmitis]
MTQVDLETPVTLKRSLSPSRASDFTTCPLLYRFRTIDRLPEPPDPVAARGTLVHAVLERLFDAPAAERTLDHASSLLPSEWDALREEDPRLAELFASGEDAAAQTQWLASATELLGSYFAIEDPRYLEPAAREERLELAHDAGVTLTGIVDRIDVSPDGLVRVVDYKTGKAPGPLFEDKALAQLKFYALVIWRTRGVIPTLLQLYYLADQSVLSYSPTEQDLLVTERRLTALWAAIASAAERGEFVAKPGPLCRFCAHQQRCPEFGGTPPELPVVQLVDASAQSSSGV